MNNTRLPQRSPDTRRCICPVNEAHGQMEARVGPLAKGGPIGTYWHCLICDVECLWPD